MVICVWKVWIFSGNKRKWGKSFLPGPCVGLVTVLPLPVSYQWEVKWLFRRRLCQLELCKHQQMEWSVGDLALISCHVKRCEPQLLTLPACSFGQWVTHQISEWLHEPKKGSQVNLQADFCACAKPYSWPECEGPFLKVKAETYCYLFCWLFTHKIGDYEGH